MASARRALGIVRMAMRGTAGKSAATMGNQPDLVIGGLIRHSAFNAFISNRFRNVEKPFDGRSGGECGSAGCRVFHGLDLRLGFWCDVGYRPIGLPQVSH